MTAALALAACGGGGATPSAGAGTPAGSPSSNGPTPTTGSATPSEAPTGTGSVSSIEPTGSSTPSAEPLRVVATTTVLADLVIQVGGDLVDVSSLVPIGGEVHTFDPSPSDVTAVANADLIVMNGLGLDDWLAPVVENAGGSALTVIRLAEDLEGVQYLEGHEHDHDDHDDDHDDEHGDEHEGEHEHDHEREGEAVNPHLWLNVAYTQRYVERLTDALVAVDPDRSDDYRAGSATYLERLAGLDEEVHTAMEGIPQEHRKVVSFHEAFPYFAQAYGLEIVDTVVDAPGQDPSARQVAALIDTIRNNGVKAIFSETQFSDSLVQTIAQETDATVVSDLYNDSLGDPPVDTYEGLIRYDVEQIVSALR